MVDRSPAWRGLLAAYRQLPDETATVAIQFITFRVGNPTWRIIPVSNMWLIDMVRKFPNWGCSPNMFIVLKHDTKAHSNRTFLFSIGDTLFNLHPIFHCHLLSLSQGKCVCFSIVPSQTK